MDRLDALPLPLLLWFRDNARSLPWRSDPTPYRVWVSEIMLQQTRVAAVLGYYGRFLSALPDVQALAGCEEDVLLKLWQGLGYYSRARNLRKAAGQIMTDFGGEFPGTYAALKKLAGVGDYTAGAIASIAFGEAVPAVDGNVLRVVARLTGDRRDVGKPETKEDIRRRLAGIIPKDMPGAFNQAMMDLGAMVCLPNGAPFCERCPCVGFCAGFREGDPRVFPVKPPKKARRVEERTVWLIFREGRVALRRRESKGLLAGLWEYPNAISPEVCPVAGEVEFAAAARHIFTHVEWHMRAYTVRAGTDELPEGWVWANRAGLAAAYAVPSAFAPFAHIVGEHI